MESSPLFPIELDLAVGAGRVKAYHYASAAPRGSMLLAHGGPGGDHKGPSNIFELLAETLVKRQIDCWTFDARGCGSSSGSPDEMCVRTLQEDLRAVAQLAFNGKGTRILLGESLGAAPVVGSIDALGATAVVLLWPALCLADTDLRGLLTAENIHALSVKGIADIEWTKLGREFAEDILSCHLYAPLLDTRVPTLLIHGTSDREVPVHQSKIAHALLSDQSKLVLVEGGDHGLRCPKEQSFVRQSVADWLEGQIR